MKKFFLINIISLAGLYACNSGSSNLVGTNANFITNKDKMRGLLNKNENSPFDGSQGYDSIHGRMAEQSCYYPGGSNSNGSQQSWYISENDINSQEYFYSEDQKDVLAKLSVRLNEDYHDSDDVIVEKNRVNLSDQIYSKIQGDWSSYGINLYGIAVRRYYVSYQAHTQLSNILNANGQYILATAQKNYKDPTKQYEYFVDMCGDHLVQGWGYYSFVIAHMSITNFSQDLAAAINDDTSIGENDGILGNGQGANAQNAVSGTINTLDVGTELQWDIYGTGNVDAATPEICSTTNSTSCNGEIVTPFFQSISLWSTQNPRSKSSGIISTQPFPGQQYLPAASWDGTFNLLSIKASIANEFNTGVPNPVTNPKMFVYSNLLNKITSLYPLMISSLGEIKNLQKNHFCSTSFPHNINQKTNCQNEITISIQSLNSYIQDLEHASSNNTSNKYHEIRKFCFMLESGDPDSNSCHTLLNSFLRPNILPYETLLNYQDKTQIIELNHTIQQNGESAIATLKYSLTPSNDDANIAGTAYSYIRGETNPKYWGGNHIHPHYLISEYGDYTAEFSDKLNNPYNLYVGNGSDVYNNTASNSLYVIPNGYSTPLINQGVTISMIGKSDLNLDGHFLAGGDIKLYQSILFKPSHYIYAICDVNCPQNVAGYLLILSKNTNLYEYAVFQDYSLHQVWSVINNNVSNSAKMLDFNSSTGIFELVNVNNPSDPNNLTIYSPQYSGNNPEPNDGITRYALSLTSSGALEIYKYGEEEQPVWSNKNELKQPSTDEAYPNVDQSSFWYKYNITP